TPSPTTPTVRPTILYLVVCRVDIGYRGNRLSVTYFREDMSDGFRRTGTVRRYSYNKYDASGFDPVSANRPPTIQELPYTPYTELRVVSETTNGSRTLKEGVEFTFSSLRIPIVRTRVTVNGAWFKTTLNNSQPLWYKPSIILNGQEMQYAGLYYDTDGNTYQSFNTNFVFDTDIPRLKLNFSIAVQNMWFTSTQAMVRNGIPAYYMDASGEIYPYTAESITDTYLQHLIRTYSSTAFDERRVPVATTINLKATKKLWNDRIGVALYVNRLASITPDYYLYGQLRRRYTSPYFGMEINFKI
ncbi:MAG: TonB-dependent receptor, partial [Muribaculaceae bacterium]|nr:TonB-dependent receptor [Muribaculaceae bacterium]